MSRQLTEHFTLDEFTLSQTAARLGLDNEPDAAALANLHQLAETLEDVRVLLAGVPILISSGYRSPAVNKAVGGVADSAHTRGLAADFTAPSFGPPKAICRVLEMHMANLGIDQLIYEYSSWVHLGLAADPYPPRFMALTIDQGGTRSGFA